MLASGAPRNALSVDVEDYFHVAALSRVISREDWPRMEYRAEASTQRLLQLFAERDVKATFFILGWVARRSARLIRSIHEAGHEIACHGMSHELIYRQSREQFAAETREAKELLEQIIGAKVLGYRAASWSITRQSLWALDIIQELGFEYDSSIFPIRHDIYGIPDAPRRPSLIRTPAGQQLIEFPPSTVRVLGCSLPVAGGGYFRLLPYWLTHWGLRRLNAEGRAFMFYLHPWEVDPEQPRIKAGCASRFRHYTNLHRTHERLGRLIGQFQFTTLRNVLGDTGLLAA